MPPINVNAFDGLQKMLIRLVKYAVTLLKDGERILVDFETCSEVDEFSSVTGSTVYHNKLPLTVNTKDYNLNWWDTGETPVMASTTAGGAGINHAKVRYVFYLVCLSSQPS
jgi:hypothetical protein